MSDIPNFELLHPVTFNIANGASLSQAINFRGYNLEALCFLSGWTAADLAFKWGATESGTFYPVWTVPTLTEVLIASADIVADRVLILTEVEKFVRGFPWVKIVSGTNGTPVNQGAAREVVGWVRPR